MNDTLKAAGRIGAELGAAKAENEKLRGLLTKALEFTEANTCGGPDVAQLIAEMRVALYRQADHVRDAAQMMVPSKILKAIAWGERDDAAEAIGSLRCLLADPEGEDEIAFPDSPEPTDAFTATDMATAAAQGFRDGQAAVEQDTAQDEQEAPVVVATAILGGIYQGGSGPELGEIDIEVCMPALEALQCEMVNSYDDVFLPLMPVAQHERIVAALTRPAQTEQQPVGYQFQDREGVWKQFMSEQHYEDTLADGTWPIRAIYAAPILAAQPAEAEGVSNARLMNTLAELARRAPLRTLHTICETQRQVSTVKLERYLEPVGDTLAGYAFTLRIDFDKLSAALSAVTAERDALAAARMAYANEFAPDENGDPDVGNVHANIRALKAERDQLRAEVEALRNEHTARESMARRLLWLAFVWNDHNFEEAHIEARREAEAHGITTLKQANEWLSRIDAAMAAKEA